MMAFLRSLLRTYTWREPVEFRCAEQFGLDEARVHALLPPAQLARA